MSLLDRARHPTAPPAGRPPLSARGAAAVVVAVVVAAGVWVTGAVLTDDAGTAMALTGGWLLAAGAVAVWSARRWRGFALPVLGAYVLTAGVLGGALFVTSTVDTRVEEEVVVAAPAAAATPGRAGTSPTGATPAAAGPTGAAATGSTPTAGAVVPEPAPALVAGGSFRSGAHETAGRAALIDLPDGQRVLTLTGFATDPGPDLRVYLTPGDGSSTRGALDLGRLKGNKGNQQYLVPRGAPRGGVVIWCRAFSVSFGTAALGR